MGDGSNEYDGAGWQQLRTTKLNNSEQYFFLPYFCANGPPPSFAPFLCTTCKVGILFLVLLLLLSTFLLTGKACEGLILALNSFIIYFIMYIKLV